MTPAIRQRPAITAGCKEERTYHAHKNQPARQQQIDQIQWLTAKTPRARREEEINKFTRRFLGVFAVRIRVDPRSASDKDVLERRGWERGDLAGTGRLPSLARRVGKIAAAADVDATHA